MIVTNFLVKESTLEIQATYSGLAFDLLNPIGNGLHENVAARLAEFCVLTANDIRISNDVAPLANANATYTLNALMALPKYPLIDSRSPSSAHIIFRQSRRRGHHLPL